MSDKKINVKDVTAKEYNPKTHKGADDRFNPSNRIYVRAVKGYYQRMRRYMGWFFMLVFLAIPWLPYQGRQAILLDIGNQKFTFFGTTLWPQDLTLLAALLMLAAFGLFFITTFLGRVWCGYLCPQTVWTFLFIWFEEKLEGAANKRRKQDSLKLTPELAARKTAKHAAWWAISLITGMTFVGYFVPMRELAIDLVTFDTSFWVGFWVIFFAACTYGNAGWMRSIMCIHMCPYARFQSAMFDKDTFIVGYDAKRGEKRGPRPRKKDPKELGLGDCIDCNLCVQVCPTGIDIRDGLQYECINCGACIDACDETMDRMGYERGLISYTTEHKLEGKKTAVMRPKLLGYGVVMTIVTAMFIYLAMSVMPMELDVIRDRNQLYRINNQGLVENTYTLKILNKTQSDETYQLSVNGLNDVEWHGPQTVNVQAGEVFSLPISLAVDTYEMEQRIADITFVMERESGDEQKVVTAESRFITDL